MYVKLSGFAMCTLLIIASGGCSSPGSATGPVADSVKRAKLFDNIHVASSSKIQHIVIIVQENRSFDNIFAGFAGADAPTYGYEHDGTQVPLSAVSFKGPDLEHSYKAAIVDWASGQMNGFDLSSPSSPTYPYSFVTRSDVNPYWSMAKQYVLADRMFPTEFGGSFAAHLNLIAGTDKLSSTLAEADNPNNAPWGCDAPSRTTTTTVDSSRKVHNDGPFPCFTQFQTMADTLDAAGVTWKYYAPQTIDCPKRCDGGGLIWSEFDAISNVRNGPDWQRDVIYPQTTVLDDAQNGTLASVSWVMPDWKDSDHTGTNSDYRTIMGGGGRQCRWQISILEFNCNHSALGRLGRLVRRCIAASAGLFRIGDPGAVHHYLAVRQSALCFSHTVRVWKRSEVHGRKLQSCVARLYR